MSIILSGPTFIIWDPIFDGSKQIMTIDLTPRSHGWYHTSHIAIALTLCIGDLAIADRQYRQWLIPRSNLERWSHFPILWLRFHRIITIDISQHHCHNGHKGLPFDYADRWSPINSWLLIFTPDPMADIWLHHRNHTISKVGFDNSLFGFLQCNISI